MWRKPWFVPVLSIAGATALYFWLGRAHVPRATFDSSAYLEAAQKPWSFDQFAYPKPVLVSLIYRLTGDSLATISNVQRLFAIAAWTCLGLAAVRSVQSPRARIAAAIVTVLFALDPVRRGYADMVLSESINDSLLALCLASLLVARQWEGRRRIIAACGCAVLACAWALARDTNAIVILVAAAVVIAAGWRTRWLLGVVVAPVAVACFALASVGFTPAPTYFSAQYGWPIEMTPRGAFSELDNVVDRVLPDPDARAYFRDHGMPQIDEMMVIAHQPREPMQLGLPGDRAMIVLGEKFAPARTWIAHDSRGVYLGWIARHPFTRIGQQARNGFTLLGAGQQFFMPKGWKRYGRARFIDYAFGLTTNRVVIVLLLLAAPFALWRRWRHPLRSLVLGVIASGYIASVAAFYADSSEVGRHCYGHGQQVLFGLCLAVLLLLDASAVVDRK